MNILEQLQFSPTIWLAQIVVFIALWIALKFLLFDPILKHLDARDASIQAAYHTVEQTRREMEELRADYQSRITQVEAEARARIQAAIREAQAERERLIAEARAQADVTLRTGVAETERLKSEALTNLKSDLVGLAVSALGKTLGPAADTAALRRQIEQRIAEKLPA
jgi:F-type H+-transporting ATPase subunit b